MSLKTILGKIRFKAYSVWFGLWVEKSYVDYGVLDQKITATSAEKVFAEIENCMRERLQAFAPQENIFYFSHIKTFDGRDRPVAKNPFPLFPPNLAAIDFLLKNKLESATIVDYCCGFNNLAVVLNSFGFTRAYGYDNFAQIKKESIVSFLQKFDLTRTLKSKEEVLALSTNVALCVCYYWSKTDKEIIKKEINNPALEYILLDLRYAPPLHIKNFKIHTVYPELLVVYKRKILS